MLLNSFINKFPFFVAVLIAFCWVIGLTFYVEPVYDTYDDSLLEWFLTGALISPQPTADVIFINIILSNILKLFYQFNNHFNWYGAFQILSIALSVAVMNYLIVLNYAKNISLKLIGITIVFLFISNIIYKVQFTQTSQIATFCGYFMLLFGYKNWFHFFLSALMLSLGLLMRWEGFLMASFIGIPSIFLKQYLEGIHLKKSIISLSVVLIIPMLFYVVHQYYYASNESWKKHLAFHQEHVILFDYTFLDRIPKEKAVKIVKESGWSETDFKIFDVFFIEDDSVFTIEKMQRITKHLASIDYFNQNNLSRIRHVVNMFTVSYSLHIAIIFFFFIVVPAFYTKSYYNILKFIITYYAWVVLFFVIVVLFIRLPSLRFLLIPLFFPAFCAMLYQSSIIDNYLFNKYKISVLILTICVVLIFLKINVLQQEKIKNLKSQALFSKDMQFLNKYKKNFLVLFNLKSPLGKKGLFTNNNDIIELHTWIAGNDLRSPNVKSILNSYGIKSITRSLPKNDNMMLVINKGAEEKILIPYVNYMQQYYRESIQYTEVDKSDQLTLYKIKVL